MKDSVAQRSSVCGHRSIYMYGEVVQRPLYVVSLYDCVHKLGTGGFSSKRWQILLEKQ